MPDWCKNSMTVAGTDTDKVNAALRSAAALFDIVAPLPPPLSELRIGAIAIDGVSHRVWRDTEDGPVPLSAAELAELEDTWGTANREDWAIENWGTNWNVHQNWLRFENGTWIFDTAWSPPLGFYEKLSAAFNVELRVAWFDHDPEWPAGGATIVEGTVTKYEVDLPKKFDENTDSWDPTTSAWLAEHTLD